MDSYDLDRVLEFLYNKNLLDYPVPTDDLVELIMHLDLDDLKIRYKTEEEIEQERIKVQDIEDIF